MISTKGEKLGVWDILEKHEYPTPSMPLKMGKLNGKHEMKCTKGLKDRERCIRGGAGLSIDEKHGECGTHVDCIAIVRIM